MQEKDEYILRKYLQGRDMDPEDTVYVRELQLIGMIKTGISIKRQKITAKTLKLGRLLLGDSYIQ
jgi:hypothetical protein